MEKQLLISLLGNKNVFTFKEALNFASSMEISIFNEILGRDDFDSDLFFEKMDDNYVNFLLAKGNQAFIAKTKELPISKLVEYMPKFSSFLGLEIIFSRSDEMVKEDYIKYFQTVVAGGTMFLSDIERAEEFIKKIKNPHVIIEIIKAIPNKIIRRLLSENIDFLDYLHKSDPKNQLEIAKIADCEGLWGQLFEDEKFLNYFLSLTPGEVLRVAADSQEVIVENIVFGRAGISDTMKLNYSYTTNRKSAWIKIFSSTMFSPATSIELGCLPDRVEVGIDGSVLEREDVVKYLNEIDSECAFSMMKNYNSGLLILFLLRRKDLLFDAKGLLEIMLPYKEYEGILGTCLDRPEVIEYIKMFKDDDLIDYAKKQTSHLLWKLVVKTLPFIKALQVVTENMNPDLALVVFERMDDSSNPKTFLFLAKIIDRREVWDKVLAIPKVNEYIYK